VANYKCGKNQTQAKQFVAAKVWLGKLWLGTKQALIYLDRDVIPDLLSLESFMLEMYGSAKASGLIASMQTHIWETN
jgi:hypothetical protein